MAVIKSYQAFVNGFTFNFTETELRTFDLVKRSPVEFHLIKELPKTATGKVQKFVLRGRRAGITAQ